jgi:hypothetical protein
MTTPEVYPSSFDIFGAILALIWFTLLNRVPSGKFNRVKVNITDQFLKAGIFFTNNRFISVLKKMTMTLMTVIMQEDGVSHDMGHLILKEQIGISFPRKI